MNEHKRSQVAARVRRYRERHRAKIAAARDLQAASREHRTRGRRPSWQVKEYHHGPGTEYSGLPAVIVVQRAGLDWRALAGRRDAAGRWCRQLQAAGLRPVESFEWLPRVVMSKAMARAVRDARVATIVRWAGGWPDFLVAPVAPVLP